MSVQYSEGFQCTGDIMSTVGGYHEYTGVFSTLGGYHEYTGGYHDKCGGRSLGKQLNLYGNPVY